VVFPLVGFVAAWVVVSGAGASAVTAAASKPSSDVEIAIAASPPASGTAVRE
jgi:hypothetical protein